MKNRQMEFKFNSGIDKNLCKQWHAWRSTQPGADMGMDNWIAYLTELLPDCEVSGDVRIELTRIIFKTEEDKNWFILKWG